MKGNYTISEKASQDIERFRLYLLSKNGNKVSNEFLFAIYRKFNLLALFPHMGKHKEDISTNLLMFPDVKYRRSIFYRKTTYGIRIVRVLGGLQDHKTIFKKEN